MADDYRARREWSDKYIPQIKTIVGPLLLDTAPLELDTKEATDLIVLRGRDMRVAARVRKPGYFEEYPQQFTIRSRVPSGAATELKKIVDGWGDWLFYGHVDPTEARIQHWMIVDLHVFRASLIRHAMGGWRVRYGGKPNGDGTHFKWFDARSFPHDIIIAATPPIEFDYDAKADFAGSLVDGYSAIRTRKETGGPGWTPK